MVKGCISVYSEMRRGKGSYYESFKPQKRTTRDRYANQFIRLNHEVLERGLGLEKSDAKLYFCMIKLQCLHLRLTQRAPSDIQMETLLQPMYSPDISPSDCHLFRSIQHSKEGKYIRPQMG